MDATQSPKLTVSVEALKLLEQGYDTLLQKRMEIERLILKQEGGIEVMRTLLAGQGDALPDVEKQES